MTEKRVGDESSGRKLFTLPPGVKQCELGIDTGTVCIQGSHLSGTSNLQGGTLGQYDVSHLRRQQWRGQAFRHSPFDCEVCRAFDCLDRFRADMTDVGRRNGPRLLVVLGYLPRDRTRVVGHHQHVLRLGDCEDLAPKNSSEDQWQPEKPVNQAAPSSRKTNRLNQMENFGSPMCSMLYSA